MMEQLIEWDTVLEKYLCCILKTLHGYKVRSYMEQTQKHEKALLEQYVTIINCNKS